MVRAYTDGFNGPSTIDGPIHKGWPERNGMMTPLYQAFLIFIDKKLEKEELITPLSDFQKSFAAVQLKSLSCHSKIAIVYPIQAGKSAVNELIAEFLETKDRK